MENKEVFAKDNEPKRILSVKMLTGNDLKLYLLMRFGTYNNASAHAGIDESRVHQICSGLDVPSNPDLIKRYAESWGVDLVVLTGLFERLRNGGRE